MQPFQYLVVGLATVGLGGQPVGGSRQADPRAVDFGSDRWTVTDGRVVEAFGRQAFMGSATLKDVAFENGVIEFDVAASSDRARSYPGVTFRARPGGEWERFYIRPHRSALYGDVLQYVAAFNGVDSWQLYNGSGATAPAVIPPGQWLHVRLEVSGPQARVFLGTATEPSLVIPRLRHGTSRGSIGVMGPSDGSAYFSNFSYRTDDTLVFPAAPPVDEVPGVVRDWQVSRVFDANAIDLEKTPEQQGLNELAWTRLSADARGLVDISRIHARTNPADAVFARSVITTSAAGVRKFDLGYSDVVSVFVNGQPVYSGNSQYQGRDTSFLGILGWFDSVFLPLRKGANEVTLVVGEVSGGWGFMLRDGTAVHAAPGMGKAWETPRRFATPETVVYDAARDCLYVSNYDPANTGGAEGQAISKLSPDGRLVAARWVGGLKNPTGLAIVGDRLFVVERQAVAEIDIARAAIVSRHPIPNAGLPNDIAAAPDGSLYITDSQRATIYRLENGTVAGWLQDRRLARPNGITVDGPRVVVGTNADGTLKAIDIATKAVTTIATLGPGVIDGLVPLGNGEYLLSHNEGRLFRVAADGRVIKLLDTTVVGWPIADFDLAKGRIVFPTFNDNRVMAYRWPAVTRTDGSRGTVGR